MKRRRSKWGGCRLFGRNIAQNWIARLLIDYFYIWPGSQIPSHFPPFSNLCLAAPSVVVYPTTSTWSKAGKFEQQHRLFLFVIPSHFPPFFQIFVYQRHLLLFTQQQARGQWRENSNNNNSRAKNRMNMVCHVPVVFILGQNCSLSFWISICCCYKCHAAVYGMPEF